LTCPPGLATGERKEVKQRECRFLRSSCCVRLLWFKPFDSNSLRQPDFSRAAPIFLGGALPPGVLPRFATGDCRILRNPVAFSHEVKFIAASAIAVSLRKHPRSQTLAAGNTSAAGCVSPKPCRGYGLNERTEIRVVPARGLPFLGGECRYEGER